MINFILYVHQKMKVYVLKKRNISPFDYLIVVRGQFQNSLLAEDQSGSACFCLIT